MSRGARWSLMVDAFSFWILLLKIGRYDENALVRSTLNKILRGCNYYAVINGSSLFGGSLGSNFRKFTKFSFMNFRFNICSLLIYNALLLRFLGEFICAAFVFAEIFRLASLYPPSYLLSRPTSCNIKTTSKTFASTFPYSALITHHNLS